MYRMVTARCPDPKDLAELRSTLLDLTAHFTSQPGAAKQLLATAQAAPSPSDDVAGLAAWTMIANVILNLDEAITKG
jgi:hypothetical protein